MPLHWKVPGALGHINSPQEPHLQSLLALVQRYTTASNERLDARGLLEIDAVSSEIPMVAIGLPSD
eukprot:8741751-Pyramimonas_sp.AAC.2